jgi:dihydroneopterin triphosphate aldolase (PTPS-III) / 6-pyruvoyltetrahydropterin synthase
MGSVIALWAYLKLLISVPHFSGTFVNPQISHHSLTMANSASRSSTAFEVYVSKDTFKFNAAHFVAFAGYRERLHGHNYLVGVRLLGQRLIGADGYLIDFGNVKAVTKAVCKRLNEHFLCPIHSDVLAITESEQSVRIECSVDGSVFVFPRQDCVMLPIVHATTEEIAIYLYAEILNGLNATYLLQRGIHTMEVTVAEAVGQEATFRLAIPAEIDGSFQLDVRQFIASGSVIPMPCLPTAKPEKEAGCCPGCQFGASSTFSDQLERLAQAINDGSLQTNGGTVKADDIQSLLEKE